ncbi:MAG: hypothetical protein V1808_02680 [Candidatus Daviesbacteria bacterium]
MDRKTITAKERGVSLIELLLVIAAVVFLVMLIGSLPSSVSSINKSRHSSLARDIASKKIDSLRKQGFSFLDLTTSLEGDPFSDPSLTSLPQGSAVYQVLDCPDTICTSSPKEQAKEVKVKVSWNESGDNKKVELTTIVASGGITQ